MEWLGVGRVRVGFVIDGIPYYAHQFLHANIIESVYMTTANLPVRYHAIGGASLASGKTLTAICSSVQSEGGFEYSTGIHFSASNEATTRSVTNAGYLPLVAIRPKLTLNGVAVRGRIIPENLSIYTATQTIHAEVIFGGAVTGGSWVSRGVDSIVEYNITGTAVSGGFDVTSGYVPASNQNRGLVTHEHSADLPLTLDIDGAHPTSPYTDQWIVAAQSMAVQASLCAASLDFREIR